MAQAPNYVVSSELESNPQLEALQTAMLTSLAERDQQAAREKINSANITVGTINKPNNYVLQPGERVVTTFGRTKVEEGKIVTPEAPAKPAKSAPVTLDEDALAKARAEGRRTAFDADKAYLNFTKLKGEDKVQAGADLLQQLFEQASAEQERIRKVAGERSGSAEALASLEQFRKLELEAMRMGRIPQGAQTIQVQQATKALNDAQIIADRLERDMIASNPILNKLKSFERRIQFDMNQAQRKADKEEATLAKLPVVLTDERLSNIKAALGITGAIDKATAANNVLKDKALGAVIDLDRNNVSALMMHTDMDVRKYAFNIIAATERQLHANADQKTKEGMEAFLTQLGKAVQDPNTFFDKNQVQKIASEAGRAVGPNKLKEQAIYEGRAKAFESILQQRSRQRFTSNVAGWAFTDPAIQSVVAAKAKDGVISMQEAASEVMAAEIKKSDGTVMQPQEKIAAFAQAADVTVNTTQQSLLGATKDVLRAEMVTEARNMATRAFVNQQLSQAFGKPYLAF